MMKLLTGSVLLFTLLVSETVRASPADLHAIKKRVNSLPLIPGDESDVNSLTQLKSKRWRLVPVKVEQVEAYGEHGEKIPVEHEEEAKENNSAKRSGEQSFARLQTKHSEYSNVNGNIQTKNEDTNKVMKNGALLDAFRHKGEAIIPKGAQPHSKELTELEFPWMNLHHKVLEADGRRINQGQDVENSVEHMEQTARNLAAYIEQTGDDSAVANFFETLLHAGKLSEAEAMIYMDAVKRILEEDSVQANRRAEEKAAEAEDEVKMILDLAEYLEARLASGRITRETYDQLRGRLTAALLELIQEDPSSVLGDKK